MSPHPCTSFSESNPGNDILATLDDAMKWFSDPANSIGCLVRKRWPDGIVRCPVCGSKDVTYLASRELWECRTRHPKAQFSVRAGTIFEDSHIALGSWLAAIWMVANSTRLSSYELARRLRITQKSAWSMLRRIKLAWQKVTERSNQLDVSVRDRESESLFRL